MLCFLLMRRHRGDYGRLHACILDVKRNKKDGLVRSVTLKTKSSVLERPIDKMVLLEPAAEVPEETKGPVKARFD